MSKLKSLMGIIPLKIRGEEFSIPVKEIENSSDIFISENYFLRWEWEFYGRPVYRLFRTYKQGVKTTLFRVVFPFKRDTDKFPLSVEYSTEFQGM